MKYKDYVTDAMVMLAKDERVIFLGQGLNYWNCVYDTLTDIPLEQKIELPIFEDTQMGLSIGLAIEGYIPITVYSRMDFLIIAMNALANHLDKIKDYSNGEFDPKVIIRTIVGGTKPLYPGVQHCQDYTDTFKSCLKNINVTKLTKKEDIIPTYKKALNSSQSSLIVEIKDLYET